MDVLATINFANGTSIDLVFKDVYSLNTLAADILNYYYGVTSINLAFSTNTLLRPRSDAQDR